MQPTETRAPSGPSWSPSSAGETYALPRDMDKESALAYWLSAAHEVFVVEEGSATVGTYFLQANHQGGGAHVANRGYMTAVTGPGRGVARAMCTHSLDRARERGFRAMQFNFVISTNDRAVRLWQSFGFEIVGRLPGPSNIRHKDTSTYTSCITISGDGTV